MRRRGNALLLLTALAWACTSSVASAHIGHGPTVVTMGGFAFKDPAVTVGTRDTVIWFWNGPDTNHTVTADPGQVEWFESDPGKPAAAVSHPVNDGFQHTFTKAGKYTYACRVHSFMRGEVTVVEIPDTGVPIDREKPRITIPKVRPSSVCARRSRTCRAPGARLSYTVTEASDLLVRIQRRVPRAGWRTVESFDAIARLGPNSTRVPLTGLRPGPHRLRMIAVDDFGNASPPVYAPFTLRAS